MTNISSAILDKITKLLALSKGTNSLGEQENAYAAAQRLLTEYNLSMADLELHSQADKEEIEVNGEELYTGQRVIQWKSDLAANLCNLNNCRLMYRYAGRYDRTVSFKIIGRPSDAAVVAYFFSHIAEQIERLSGIALKQYGGGKSFTNSFKLGAVDTVAKRLKEAQVQVYQEHQASAAMVLVNQRSAEIAQYMNKLGLKNKQTTRSNTDALGWEKGKEAGHKVDLNKALNSSKTNKRLG